MIHIIAPRKKEFGCGVCDQNDIVVQKLNTAGVHTRTSHLTRANSFDCNSVQAGDVVFIQLSIYGFSERGVPHWLPSLLRILKYRGARLVTYFHELWVQWPPIGSSAFWLAPLQYFICKQILKISNTAVFNVEWGYNWAKKHSKSTIKYIRTFSNVGEPSEVIGWTKRANNIVIFGNARARADIYRALLESTNSKLSEEDDLLICDIGTTSQDLEQLLSPTSALSKRFRQIKRMGPMSASDISSILGTSKFGLVATPWSHAGKSSVMASYAAHGVCPVSIHAGDRRIPQPLFPPIPEQHYALLDTIDLRSAGTSVLYSQIAIDAHKNYQSSRDVVDLLLSELGGHPASWAHCS